MTIVHCVTVATPIRGSHTVEDGYQLEVVLAYEQLPCVAARIDVVSGLRARLACSRLSRPLPAFATSGKFCPVATCCLKVAEGLRVAWGLAAWALATAGSALHLQRPAAHLSRLRDNRTLHNICSSQNE